MNTDRKFIMENNQQNDKQYTEGIALTGKRGKWIENYWYHYKWVTIVAAFFLVVFIICTVQMCTKKKNDLILVYAGRNQLSVAECEDICKVFEAYCPEDFDGDGEKSISISAYCIMSEEQIKEAQAQTDAAGDHVFIDKSYNSSQYDTYYNYISTGESSVLLLDAWLFESLVAHDRVAPLEEMLGYTPDGAVNEYGVRLGDTDMYENYGVIKNLLPEDTVVCILRPYVAGKSSKEKLYEREKQMFVSLVESKED